MILTHPTLDSTNKEDKHATGKESVAVRNFKFALRLWSTVTSGLRSKSCSTPKNKEQWKRNILTVHFLLWLKEKERGIWQVLFSIVPNQFIFCLLQGYISKKNRIHYSGPLMPPSGNIDEMLKEHEKQIQQAVRRARIDRNKIKKEHIDNGQTESLLHYTSTGQWLVQEQEDATFWCIAEL